MSKGLSDFLNTFSTLSKKPHKFLSVQEDVALHLKDLVKELYDYVKCNEEPILKNTLPELIVDQFDEEQIWQELELQNESFTSEIIPIVSQLCAKKDNLVFPLKLKCNSNNSKQSNNLSSDQKESGDVEDEGSNNENEDYDDGEDSENRSSDEELESGSKISFPKKVNLKPSVVDDKFFKLAELELFLNKEEKNQDGKEDETETFNLFDDIEDAPTNYKYSDFFENPEGDPDESIHSETENYNEIESEVDEDVSDGVEKTSSKRKLNNESDEENSNESNEETTEGKNTKSTVENTKRVRFLSSSDEEGKSEEETFTNSLFGNKKKEKTKSDQIKSSLEKRKERLGQVISKLEEEALAEKPWQLKGEINATDRPQNSLLEEVVDFDVSVRPAPVITTEVTMRLEDIIIQRIKDKAWDDVERKVKPVDTPSDFKKKLALDQEKSKLSLAEVYEQEFIKQREAATTDDTERQETEPPLHVEVRSMLNTLFNKLDALSNYHYTPRPVAPELKVISNTAAITMEEVAPVTVSDSALLAPQEIKGKKRRGELMSKEERTETDKKRARRLKKTLQRRRQRDRAKVAKMSGKVNPDLENKTSELKGRKSTWDISSSNVTKMNESKEKVIRGSTSFFNKLQEEVKSTIKKKASGFAKKKSKPNISAKKLKL